MTKIYNSESSDVLWIVLNHQLFFCIINHKRIILIADSFPSCNTSVILLQLFWTKICIAIDTSYCPVTSSGTFYCPSLSVHIFTIMIIIGQPCGYLISIFNYLSWYWELVLVIGGTTISKWWFESTYFHRNTKLFSFANYKIPRFWVSINWRRK